MRRKRRMEDAQKTNMSNLMLQQDQCVENKRRFLQPSGAFPGSLYLVRHPASREHQPHQPSGPVVRPNTPGSHLPLPTSLIKNMPLATRDQNVTPPSSGQPSVGQPAEGTPVMFRPLSSKQESDEKSSCQVASTAHHSTTQPQVPMNVAGVERRDQVWNSQQFPDETIPIMRGQGSGPSQEVDDVEWRQQQIQSIMNQVQQSVSTQALTLWFERARPLWPWLPQNFKANQRGITANSERYHSNGHSGHGWDQGLSTYMGFLL